jgi:hypothetical protein
MNIERILKDFFDIIIEGIVGFMVGVLLDKAIAAESLNWPWVLALSAMGVIDVLAFARSVIVRVSKWF